MADNPSDNLSKAGETSFPHSSNAGSWFRSFRQPRPDIISSGLIFVACFFIFWFSPVHQVSDSSYSLLLSQSLWQHQSFKLDHYAIPRLPPHDEDNANKNGNIHQLELVGNHIYYFFPPGSSVLSIPFVAMMNKLGMSAANADGTYNLNGEIKLEVILAAILMAAAAVLFFLTARLELPLSWSLVIALGAALGTQVWSTGSRALWSDTWGVLLSAIIIYLLLAAESGKREIRPVLLATLLAWSYFVRPTASVSIIGITAYMFFRSRRRFLPYVVTGAAWLLAFFVYSWVHFGKLLPSYYSGSRLKFQLFFTALLGHLISPSRGLLVYTPALIFLFYLLVRYRRNISYMRLVWLSLFVIAGHLVVISGFGHWWGGFCYGSRLTTGLVPWFVLLAIVAVKAMRSSQAVAAAKSHGLTWRLQLVSGAILLAVSVFINARGAIARETWIWNTLPVNVDRRPDRLWSWANPQMLAGLVRPPLPAEFPPATDHIDFVKDDSTKYLWYGWSAAEAEIRWTDGTEAAVIFTADKTSDISLQIKLTPFVIKKEHEQQRVNIDLNGTQIQALQLTSDAPQVFEFVLPRTLLQQRNILTFGLPDAKAPVLLGISDDLRALGIAVWWVHFGPGTAQLRPS